MRVTVKFTMRPDEFMRHVYAGFADLLTTPISLNVEEMGKMRAGDTVHISNEDGRGDTLVIELVM